MSSKLEQAAVFFVQTLGLRNPSETTVISRKSSIMGEESGNKCAPRDTFSELFMMIIRVNTIIKMTGAQPGVVKRVI